MDSLPLSHQWSPVCPYIRNIRKYVQFSSVQSLSSLWLFAHELQHARPLCPSPTPGVYSNSRPSSWWSIQPSHLLSSPSSPAFNLSQHQGLFKWVSSLHQVAKCWSFRISPSNEYSGLISFRIDWLDLLAVQGDFQESSPAPQFKSINTSVLSLL